MRMLLELHVTPRAFKANEHLQVEAHLGAGTCAKAPGKWRVVKCVEDLPLGMIRRFMFELEPLDAVACTTAANQQL